MVGKRIIETRLTTSITIKKENAVAALEVMSRFAVDPRWLVYLPPTMSPTATSDREGLLEHPHEAFAAYRTGGVELVVCEESTWLASCGRCLSGLRSGDGALRYRVGCGGSNLYSHEDGFWQLRSMHV